MSWFLFILLAVVTLGGGLGVVLTRNVVHAALALLVSLLAVAGVYLILFAEFLALVQVLIYGGAIIIVPLVRYHAHPQRGIPANHRQPAVAAGNCCRLGNAGGIGRILLDQGGDEHRAPRAGFWRLG